MENEINNRIRHTYKSMNLTLKDFCLKSGLVESTTRNMFNRGTNPSFEFLEKVANAYPDLNANWLITGKGGMYKSEQHTTKGTDTHSIHVDEPLREYLPTANFKLLPLMNMDIAGGCTNQEVDTTEYIEKYIPFVDARDGDIACPVTNNSMTPVYPPGTIVQMRKVERWREYIEYGQVYVVDLVDGRRLIKQVRKSTSKDKFTLVSFNKEYDEDDVSKDMIYGVWLVIAKYEKLVM